MIILNLLLRINSCSFQIYSLLMSKFVLNNGNSFFIWYCLEILIIDIMWCPLGDGTCKLHVYNSIGAV